MIGSATLPGAYLVRRAGRYTSTEIHPALFPGKIGTSSPIDVKQAIRSTIRKRQAGR
jgi:hypothetical protein